MRPWMKNAAAVAAVAAAATGVYWVARLALAPVSEDDWSGFEEPDSAAASLAQGERFERVSTIVRPVAEEYPGRIAAGKGVPVTVPPGMRCAVIEIVKDQGDAVKKGDVLLRFNREELDRETMRAKERNDEAALAHYRELAKYVELRSPVDGIVRDCHTELGRTPVDAGMTALYHIVDENEFQIRVQVPATVPKLGAHIGARLTVDLEGSFGSTEGVVTGYEDAPEGWTVLVIGLDPMEGYEVDMKGSVKVPVAKEEVVLVPKAAVRERGGVKIVRVWEPADRLVADRSIQTDGEREDFWIVTAGVLPGESIVVPDSVR